MRINHYIALVLTLAGIGAFGLTVVFELLAAGYQDATQQLGVGSDDYVTVNDLVQKSDDMLVSLDLATVEASAMFILSERLIGRCRADIDKLANSPTFPDDRLVQDLKAHLDRLVKDAQAAAVLPGESPAKTEALAAFDATAAAWSELVERLQHKATRRAEAQAKELDRLQAKFFWSTAAAGLGYFAILIVLWRLTAILVIGPFRRLTRQISQSEDTLPGEHLVQDSPRELRELAAAYAKLIRERQNKNDELQIELERRLAAEQQLRATETERREALEQVQATQQQLRQHQRLESLGTLAGGVAHEINNPINGIINYAQLIQDQLDGENPAHNLAHEIGKESRRVTEIVRNLLTFARQDQRAASPVDVRDIIDETTALIRTIIRRDQIDLQIDVPTDLPTVNCRGQQIQQVVMNLLTNARDALNERYPGFHEDKLIRVNAGSFAEDGNSWIRITVEDHGCGVSPEVSEHMFDPFFTTKDRTLGTGLGLAISHGIVTDHHGRLRLETEPGKLTRFHLELPVDGDGFDPVI